MDIYLEEFKKDFLDIIEREPDEVDILLWESMNFGPYGVDMLQIAKGAERVRQYIMEKESS